MRPVAWSQLGSVLAVAVAVAPGVAVPEAGVVVLAPEAVPAAARDPPAAEPEGAAAPAAGVAPLGAMVVSTTLLVAACWPCGGVTCGPATSPSLVRTFSLPCPGRSTAIMAMATTVRMNGRYRPRPLAMSPRV